MTKLGAFLLKRLNLVKLAFISLVGASLLFSCKSTPDLAPVDPFELLDSGSAMYLSVPVQAHQDFVVSAIQKVAGAAESDAQKIAERLDTAYISLGANGDLQLSCSGKIPQNFIGLALNEKKGWKPGVIEQQTVYTHKQSLYQLCLPSSSNAFLSNNIEPMVKRFNRIAYSDQTISEKLLSESMNEGLYRLLHDNNTPDIVMYSSAPQAFIKSMLGASGVNVPVESFFAVLSQYRGVKEQFNVKLVINMSDPRTVKATSALLKTALFGVPAKISQTGQKQITITDLPVSKARLLGIIR
jgi:hypothetical protein